MKRIVLFCAAGLSTSLLVNKMRAVAKEKKYECEINAYSVAEVDDVCKDADVILLGPQVRFNLEKIKQRCPHCPVAAIDINDYSKINGEGVFNQAVELIDTFSSNN